MEDENDQDCPVERHPLLSDYPDRDPDGEEKEDWRKDQEAARRTDQVSEQRLQKGGAEVQPVGRVIGRQPIIIETHVEEDEWDGQ